MVDAMDVSPEDTVVTLGDYVGKGPDSRGVLELLIALHGRCRLVPLLGNHDILMRSAVNGELNQSAWSMFGAVRILNSYGTVQAIESIPATHRDFLRSCKLYHETDSHLFAHASYDPLRSLEETDEATLIWERLAADPPVPHSSGKTAIVGHSSQESGEVLDLGHVVCIDTNCWAGGWLTGMDVDSREIIQVDRDGNIRD
jgi:serine/threonine protein phosphatase 1